MMPLEEFVSFAAVVCLGIFTQSATGFAGGLVIMPLMLWVGHGVPEAQAALLTATLPQNALGFYRFRHTVATKELMLPGLLRFLSLPIGVGALYWLDGFPREIMRQVVSGVVIVCVMLLLMLRPEPKERVHIGWAWLAFLSSGFFVGLTGTGGPMMVIWVQAHDWSTERSRAFLFVMYLLTIPPAMLLLYIAFGQRIVTSTIAAMVLLPLLLGVTQVGLRAGSWLGRDRLRKLTMVLLLVTGFVGLVGPFVAPFVTRWG